MRSTFGQRKRWTEFKVKLLVLRVVRGFEQAYWALVGALGQ